MKNNITVLVLGIASAVAVGCASMAHNDEAALGAKALELMKASFHEQGQAKLDRLEQDDVQKVCSEYNGDKKIPKGVAEGLEKAQLATIKYPADGKYLGDWKNGERIAQSGVGMQFTDTAGAATGGNCYACHELTKAELAFGTIGPSLYNFGKTRGYTPEMQKYAFGKVYNSEAFSACSNMPRFGHKGILSEQQVKDVVALLMDPNSPVNK
ncbi:MAG TPA: sulfur oxidation c-type cytochrome SoxX [Usitatibacter sp.]|nr:sulfur oxidation c-type cytochrome SoxX [Usitatibacter sp.]